MTETTKMRAVSQDEVGGPDVLKLVELDRPRPRASEVLVRVHAAGLNPTDWKHRAKLRDFDSLPFVLGWDVSGVVEAVAPGVALWEPGDEVFGMLPYPYGAGAFAEYVTAPARAFAAKPSGIDHVTAGAIPLAALTAWQALVDTAHLEAGRRVLIHAAAGGVGHLAVQIAKARGAYVIGTASTPKHDLLRRLGADELIDYRETDFATAVKDVDVVLDAIGGDYGTRSLSTLRPGGIIVSILVGSTPDLPEEAAAQGKRAKGMLVEYDHTGMRALADLIESGHLHPEIAAVYPLSEASQAHEHGETNHTTGKIVLDVTA